MRVWGSNPGTTAKLHDAALVPESEVISGQLVAAPSANWRTFAAVAAVTLLGWPFISTGTAHAMWAEISRFLSLRGRS